MQTCVACRTKGNKILLGIIAGPAPKLPVMTFKVGYGSAGLASPAVVAQLESGYLLLTANPDELYSLNS